MRATSAFRPLLLAIATAACPALARDFARVEPPSAPADPAPASNMGFSAQVDLSVSSGETDGEIVALPLFLGTGDIADASAAIPCSEAGALRSDGVIDALDLLCELWTSRDGGLWISRRDSAAGTWQSRGIWRLPSGGFAHGGDWLDPIVQGEAVLAVTLAPTGGAVVNRATIVGSHDGSAACPVIAGPAGVEKVALLNVFYHTMFQEADELLCGLRGRDWDDADGDGAPDTCDAGLFDPSAAGSATVIDLTGTVPQARSVTADPAGAHGLRFDGTSFALTVTRGQLAVLSSEQPPATWCQPHF